MKKIDNLKIIPMCLKHLRELKSEYPAFRSQVARLKYASLLMLKHLPGHRLMFEPFVAINDEKVKGIAALYPTKSKTLLNISNVFVTHQDRRRGIGTALINHLLAKAREAGMEKVSVCVNIRNRAGLALYRKCGFNVREHIYYMEADLGERTGKQGGKSDDNQD